MSKNTDELFAIMRIVRFFFVITAGQSYKYLFCDIA